MLTLERKLREEGARRQLAHVCGCGCEDGP